MLHTVLVERTDLQTSVYGKHLAVIRPFILSPWGNGFDTARKWSLSWGGCKVRFHYMLSPQKRNPSRSFSIQKPKSSLHASSTAGKATSSTWCTCSMCDMFIFLWKIIISGACLTPVYLNKSSSHGNYVVPVTSQTSPQFRTCGTCASGMCSQGSPAVSKSRQI